MRGGGSLAWDYETPCPLLLPARQHLYFTPTVSVHCVLLREKLKRSKELVMPKDLRLGPPGCCH